MLNLHKQNMELAHRNGIQNEENTVEYTEEDPLRQNVNEQKPKRNCIATCMYILKNVSVEPCVTLFIIPYMLMSVTFQNLALEKACRVNLNFSDDICTALREQEVDSQNEFERETQRLLAAALSWKSYMTATIPCLLGIFVGTFSDITGHRKMFLTLPVIGQMLACANSILNTFFLYELNLETFTLVEGLFESISGGKLVFVVIVFSIISTITTAETRTFRLGMVSFALTIGFPIGTALSGVLLKYLGYYGCYGIAAGIHLMNLLYIILVVKDPVRSEEQRKVSCLLIIIIRAYYITQA